MDTAIITAIISAATTLIVSMGTWHISAKSARKKETDAMKSLIENYRDELRGKMQNLVDQMQNVRDEIREVDNNMQKQIIVLDDKIENLSKQVEKHNSVIERTYKLEKDSEVQEEKIRVVNHRLEDLEAKVRA